MKHKITLALLLATVVLIAEFSSCGHHDLQPELQHIDSLLRNNQSADALQQLGTIDTSSFNQEENAFYAILLTMAKYKELVNFRSDSAINAVVDYFKRRDNQEMLMKALVAQGCVEDAIGNKEHALDCFLQAERITTDIDIDSKAYVKLRLADLYHSQLIKADSLAIRKYFEALNLYQEKHDLHYQIVCLGEIGGLYINNKYNSDSALYYIDAAIHLAEQTSDTYYLFSNYYCKSLYYFNTKHDYHKAKESALKAISYTNEIDHPRAHYCLINAYLRLGKIDSANYYMALAPAPSNIIDSISYYNIQSEIETFNHHEAESRNYFLKSNNLADSLLMHSLSHRLFEIEKKYDLQQEELNNVSLRAKLRGAWLAIAISLLAALVLLHLLWRYRNRLRDKEHEYELLKSDLNTSLSSLEQMQATIDNYEDKLSETVASYKAKVAQQESLVTDLTGEIASVKSSLQEKEQERLQLDGKLAELEAKRSQSQEIKAILDGQIKVVHELIQSSHELDAERFARRFTSLMSVPDSPRTATYWSNLQALTNDLYNNILVDANQMADGKLLDSDINFIALLCCGYSRTVIMICMKFKNVVTISNKKKKIAKKMGVPSLEQFILPYQQQMAHTLQPEG